MRRLACIFFICFSFSYFSQDVRDIVRISETQVFGSARFEAMAGSFGSLGADLSSSSINPAGYGRYSSSAFGLGIQRTNISNSAIFNSFETKSNLTTTNLNNLGIVFVNDISERNRGFIFSQFGFSYNLVQNYQNAYSYSGVQHSSLLDAFCALGNQVNPLDLYSSLAFSTALAWDTYTIDQDGFGGYVPRLGLETNVHHRRTLEEKGKIGEYNFNVSGNYMNKLYIGGNLGIRSLSYQEDMHHYEYAINNTENLDSFNYQYHLKTKGSGVNFKFGIIYLPLEHIRIGLSLHTPTFYKLSDTYSADMNSFNKDTTYSIPFEYKPQGAYKYRLQSPTKLVGSFAYIFGTKGCINADLELINYDWAKLKSSLDSTQGYYSFDAENKESRQELRTVLNLRLGGELVFNSQYFLRAGFAIYPSAYDKSVNPAKGSQVYSCGIGFKWKRNVLDLCLKVQHRNFNYYAFNESFTEVNTIKNAIVINYSVSF